MEPSVPPKAARKLARTTYGKKGRRSLGFHQARERAMQVGIGEGRLQGEDEEEEEEEEEVPEVPEPRNAIAAPSGASEDTLGKSEKGRAADLGRPAVPDHDLVDDKMATTSTKTEKSFSIRKTKRKRSPSPLPGYDNQDLTPVANVTGPSTTRTPESAEKISSSYSKRQRKGNAQTDTPPILLGSAPDVQFQPPTSSPPRAILRHLTTSPITPVRSPEHSSTRVVPRTPNTPPRDLSAVYRAVSPSPRSHSKTKPKGRMLTRTESTGEMGIGGTRNSDLVMASPVKLAAAASLGSLDRASLTPGRRLTFGGSLPEGALHGSPGSKGSEAGSEFGTPTKRMLPARMHSMSESPSKGMSTTGGPIRKTYGKSRSYMTMTGAEGSPHSRAGSEAGDPPLSQGSFASGGPDNIASGSSPMGKPRQSYNDLRKQFAMDDRVEGTEEGDAQGGETARANNLRSKGQNRRFMDELGYLMDGLQEASVSVRIHSALELLSKSLDEDWFEKLRTCGEVETLLTGLLRSRLDMGAEILDLSCLLYIASLARHPNLLQTITSVALEDVFTFLSSMAFAANFSFGDDASRTGKAKVAKPSMLELRSLRDSLGLASVGGTQPSASAIAADILGKLLLGLDSVSDYLERRIISLDLIPALVARLEKHGPSVTTWLDSLAASTITLGRSRVPDIRLLAASSRILRLATQSTECLHALESRSSACLATLLLDMVTMTECLRGSAWSDTEAQETKLAAQQIVFALVAISSAWCDSIGGTPTNIYTLLRALNGASALPEASSDEASSAEDGQPGSGSVAIQGGRDSIMLLVGIVYHLLDRIDLDSLLRIDVCRSIPTKETCFRSCQCGQSISAARLLVDLYQDEQGKADDAQAAFLSGYLALLLTRVMQLHSSARAELLDLLGHDHGSAKGTLTESLVDLQTVYAKVHNVMSQHLQDAGIDGGIDSRAIGLEESDTLGLHNTERKAGEDIILEQAAEALAYLKSS